MKSKQGVQVSRTSLKQLAKRVQVDWKLAKQFSTEKVAEALYHAKKNYFQQKPNFSTWRKEFHQASIEALANKNTTSAEAERKREKQEEQSKKMGKASQRITDKGIKKKHTTGNNSQ